MHNRTRVDRLAPTASCLRRVCCEVARVLTAVALTVAALATPCTSAQSPTPFAAPLSSADLERWVSAFALEDDARRAVEAAFERSLAESQALRDGEMAAFERDSSSATGSQVSLESLEQRSRKAKALAARQAAIENRLFDELALQIPEHQLQRLDMERRSAARRRNAATLDLFQRNGVVPDLITLMRRSATDIDSAESTAIIVDYDQRLSDLSQRMATLALESGPAIRRARDASEAERAGAAANENPDASARDRMRASMQAREAALAPLHALRNDIVSLHRAAFERLVPTLPPERARHLRQQFIQSHYATVSIKRDTPERLLQQVKSLSERDGSVTPESIATAERIIDSWRERVESIERKMMDAIDDRRQQRGGDQPFLAAPDGDEPFAAMGHVEDGLGELRGERDEATRSARNELASLHPVFADLARDDKPAPQFAFGGPDAAVVHGGRVSAIMVMDGDAGGGDAIAIEFSPDMMMGGRAGLQPIDPRGFDAMLARLGLSDAKRAEAKTAFESYRTTAEEHLKSLLGEARSNGPIEVGGGGMLVVSQGDPPPPESLDAAMAQLANDDEAFFTALGDSSDPGLARERSIRARDRLRQRIGIGGSPMLQPWGRFEKVDLVVITTEAPLPADRREHVDALALAHGERMTALLARMLAAQDSLRRAEAALTRTVDHGDGRIERTIDINSDNDQEFSRAMRALSDSLQAMTDDVRRTLGELEAQLPPDVARRIRRAAYAQAMPQIVSDPRSAESRLEQAIMLETISDETRRALIELLAAHQDSVDALVDRFVDDSESAARANNAPRGPGPGEMRAMRQSDGLQHRLRFDRSEVNDASMRRLRAILSAAENAQIENLPPSSPAGGAAFSISF